jgi:hypothetical protein
VPSERHVARRTKGNREGKSTDDGSVYLKATRPDDTFVGMAKQQCPYCGQMFDDVDAHLRSSLPLCVLVTKNTVAQPAKESTRLTGSDPELEGVAGISYNVKR